MMRFFLSSPCFWVRRFVAWFITDNLITWYLITLILSIFSLIFTYYYYFFLYSVLSYFLELPCYCYMIVCLHMWCILLKCCIPFDHFHDDSFLKINPTEKPCGQGIICLVWRSDYSINISFFSNTNYSFFLFYFRFIGILMYLNVSPSVFLSLQYLFHISNSLFFLKME